MQRVELSSGGWRRPRPRSRILACAAPFGFGPAAKLLTVTRRLADRHDVTFAGSGVAAQLAGHETFFRAMADVDWETAAGRRSLREMAAEHDLVLSAGEPVALEAAASAGVPAAYVDSLLWMWDELPPSAEGVGLYVAQRYPGVESSRHLERIRNLRLVGPIVDHPERSPQRERGFLLVNLAGLESPFYKFGRNLDYPDVVLDAIERATYQPRWQKVVVTGNRAVLEDWASRRGLGSAIQYVHLPHREFISTLAAAEMLITSPGLTATYEALAHFVPVRFLPPQNYSQALMIETSRRLDMADISLTWSDIYPELQVTSGLPEAEGVRRVVEAIRTVRRDPSAMHSVAEAYQAMLHADPPSAEHQRRALGIPWTDGAQEAALAIDGYLRSLANSARPTAQ